MNPRRRSTGRYAAPVPARASLVDKVRDRLGLSERSSLPQILAALDGSLARPKTAAARTAATDPKLTPAEQSLYSRAFHAPAPAAEATRQSRETETILAKAGWGL